MRWTYTIDLVTYEDPFEWEKAKVLIDRDSDLVGGIVIAFETQVIFRGDAYDYIIQQVDSDGWCYRFRVDVAYTCDNTTSNLGQGFYMFANEMEIDRRKCTVKAILHENTYASLVASNKKIPFAPDKPESKSGATITAATDQQINFFNNQTGIYTNTNREFYTVAEVLEYAVDFMTDGAVTCDPVPFSALGDHPGLCIGTGKAIRQTAEEAPPITNFEDLYNELRVRYNLGFYMVGTVLTIDYLDNIYGASSGITLDNVREITQAFKSELVYSKVTIGTGTTQLSEGGTFAWPDIRLFNFKEEEFYVDHICNPDAVLSLNGDYVTDSNVIEDIVINSVEDYDDDIFLVETGLFGSTNATQYDEFNIGAAPYVYNVGLTNREILDRFAGWIPNDLILGVGNGQDQFRATQTTSQTQTGLSTPFVLIVPFDDDTPPPAGNEDPNGNYNTVLYRYVAPANGFYRFGTFITVNFSVNPLYPLKTTWDFDLRIIRRSSIGTFIEDRVRPTVSASTTNESATFEPSGFYMVSGDYVEVEVTCTPLGGGPGGPDFDVIGGGNNVFYSLEHESGGGNFAGFDPDEYRIITYTTEAPLAVPEFITILGNPEKSLTITFKGQNDVTNTVTGHIDSLEYEMDRQVVQVTVVKNENGS